MCIQAERGSLVGWLGGGYVAVFTFTDVRRTKWYKDKGLSDNPVRKESCKKDLNVKDLNYLASTCVTLQTLNLTLIGPIVLSHGPSCHRNS